MKIISLKKLSDFRDSVTAMLTVKMLLALNLEKNVQQTGNHGNANLDVPLIKER